MKKNITIIMSILIFIFGNISVKASEDKTLDNKYISEISKKKIIVGSPDDSNYLEKNKDICGYEAGLIKYLRETLRLSIEVINVGNKGLDMLNNGEIDILLGTPLVKDMPKETKAIEYNHLGSFLAIGKKEFKSSIHSSYNLIGAVRDNFTEDIVRNSFRNIQFYNTEKELFNALSMDKIDIALLEYHKVYKLLSTTEFKVIDNVKSTIFNIGAITKNQRLFKLVDIINSNMKTNQDLLDIYNHKSDYSYNLIKKEFKDSLNDKEKQYIEDNKKLNLSIDMGKYPVYFMNYAEKQGTLFDMINDISKITGININLESNGYNKNRLAAIEISSNQISDKNMIKVFSSPFLVVGKQSDNRYTTIHDISRYKVGSLKGYKLEENNYFLGSDLKIYDNIDNLIKSFENGVIHYLVVDRSMFRYLIENKGITNIKSINSLDLSENYYINLNNTDEDLKGLYIKAINTYFINNIEGILGIKISEEKIINDHIEMLDKRRESYYNELQITIGLIVVCITLSIVSIIIYRKNFESKRKLECVLRENPNIDIISIDVKLQTIVSDTKFRLFKGHNIYSFNDYLKVINLSKEKYIRIYNNNIKKGSFEINYSINIDGEERYFKDYAKIGKNGEVMSIVVDISKEVYETKRFKKEANIDSLTSLYNRNYYQRKIYEVIEKNPDTYGIFVFIDLNDFKKYNDTYGHVFGDSILKEISSILKTLIDDNTVVFRISGDEFGIYKHGIDNKEYIYNFKKMLEDKFTSSFKKGLDSINISCSIGISIYNYHSRNIKDLFNYADLAMYISKKRKCEKSIATIYDNKIVDKDINTYRDGDDV